MDVLFISLNKFFFCEKLNEKDASWICLVVDLLWGML